MYFCIIINFKKYIYTTLYTQIKALFMVNLLVYISLNMALWLKSYSMFKNSLNFERKKNQKIGGLRQFPYLKNKYSNIQIKALFLKGYSGIHIIKFGFVVKKLCFI